jgi:hypothetical protein
LLRAAHHPNAAKPTICCLSELLRAGEAVANMPKKQQSSKSSAQAPSNTDALSIALAHAALSSDVKVLCAAAGTCKTWRDTVQQCCAGSIHIELHDAPVPQLQSLAKWLRANAVLLRSMVLQGVKYNRWETEEAAAWKAIPQQLAQALQQSAATTASSAAAAASTSRQQQQQGLKLAEFTRFLGSAAALAALPVHSLTQLDLSWGSGGSTSGPTLSKALVRLSNLQRLRLRNSTGNKNMPACLAGIAQLRQLTSLTLHGEWNRVDAPLQKLLQQSLPLRQLHIDLSSGFYELPNLDMSELRQLTAFVTSSSLHEDLVLPAQLQRLQFGECKEAEQLAAVMPLQQLQQLRFRVEFDDEEPLLELAQLPALQQLALEYTSAFTAAAAAPAWKQLPQLCELTLGYRDGAFHSRRDMAEILAGVAASSSLTKLQMEVWAGYTSRGHGVPPPEDDEDSGSDEDAEAETCSVPTCGSLTGLTCLQDLCLGGELSELRPGDALALTALTALTWLVLKDLHVGDESAAAIVSSLTELRHLDLRGCAVRDTQCLEAIGRTQKLTELLLDSKRHGRLPTSA